MKKILAIALALVLLVSVVSMSFAVTVSVDGNLRLWYGFVKNDNYGAGTGNSASESSFRFDRLALDVAAAIDQNSGLFSEIQFRNIRTDSEAAGASYSTATTGTTGVDIRVDQAYYYWKNALINGDTFMTGVFDGQVPYKNGYGYALISGGLGDATKTAAPGAGIVYQIVKPVWSIGAAVTNAKSGQAQDDASTDANSGEEGYNWSSRLNWTPFAGFKAGVGYAYVLDAVNATTFEDYYSHRMVADISYSNPAVCPISGMIEYSKISDKDFIQTDDSVSAVYGELGYTVGKFVIYGGRAINLSDKANFMVLYDNNAGFVGYNNFKQFNNYTVFGVKYTVTPNTYLQAEAVMIQDGTVTNSYAGKTYAFDGAEWLGVRYMVTF